VVETCLDSRILGLLAFFFLCVCKACVSSFLSKAFLPLPTRLKRFTFEKFHLGLYCYTLMIAKWRVAFLLGTSLVLAAYFLARAYIGACVNV